MQAPAPTKYENQLAAALSRRKIPYKVGLIIWYTRADYYTPDFIIGERLIVEVDGSIHDREFKKTPDRIRHRALQNLGYSVYRVKNSHIRRSVKEVTEEIIQKYYESIEQDKRGSVIYEIRKPIGYDTVPEEMRVNIASWAISLNEQLGEESRTATGFRIALAKFHPEFATNQSAMERLMLLLLGLNLEADVTGMLNFDKMAWLFNRSILILQELFGEQGKMASIHLKNMFNISAPGFFKNLVFIGGPRIKPGIISIRDVSSLKCHIDRFNHYFAMFAVSVKESEVKTECMYTLDRESNRSQFSWLTEWNPAS